MIDRIREVLKEAVLLPREDEAIDRIRCSRTFLDKLLESAKPDNRLLAISPLDADFAVNFCGVPIHADPMLPDITAAVQYKNGRIMLIYENGNTILLPSLSEQTKGPLWDPNYGLLDRAKDRDESKEQNS